MATSSLQCYLFYPPSIGACIGVGPQHNVNLPVETWNQINDVFRTQVPFCCCCWWWWWWWSKLILPVSYKFRAFPEIWFGPKWQAHLIGLGKKPISTWVVCYKKGSGTQGAVGTRQRGKLNVGNHSPTGAGSGEGPYSPQRMLKWRVLVYSQFRPSVVKLFIILSLIKGLKENPLCPHALVSAVPRHTPRRSSAQLMTWQ